MTAGDVTSSSAILWGRANGRATVILQVARNRRFSRSLTTFRRAGRTITPLRRKVRRLRANKRYWFRFVSGRRESPKGRSEPLPRRQNVRIRFAWTGDTDFSSAGPERALLEPRRRLPPHPGGAQPLQRPPGRHDLLGQRGARPAQPDRAPRSAEVGQVQDEPPQRPPPPSARRGRLLALGRPRVRERPRPPSTFSNNVNINGGTLYRRGVAAFRDYAPVNYSRRNGLYRSFRWGRTSRSSSSTSAPSARPRPMRAASATTRRPASRTWRRRPRRGFATCSARPSPRPG